MLELQSALLITASYVAFMLTLYQASIALS
jgi:hypothetical protein